MAGYGPSPGVPAAPRPPASPAQRAAILAYTAGGLGILSFIWGFLDWFTQGSGTDSPSASGYSLNGAGATAIVGLSLVAGLIAAAYAFEKHVPTLVPAAFAVAALLLVVAVMIGKGGIDDGSGDSGPDIGMGVGMILTLITSIVQVGVLVVAWMMATGRMPASRPQSYPGGYGQPPNAGQQAQQYGPPQQPGYPGQSVQPGQYDQPGQFGPPQQPGYPGQQGPSIPPANPYGLPTQ
ncbi:MAG: DUF5336 domain-containing protein [Jatrophihabitantaceae bacterium]